MRHRTATNLQIVQHGTVSPAELVREALDLQACELQLLERRAGLMAAIRVRTHRALQERVVQAATPEQMAQLGTFAERIDGMNKKCFGG